MSESQQPDWEPKSEEVIRDQRAAYDAMRHHCPVAYSEFFGWSLFRHEDVMRVLHDHERFSNAGSQHLSVPNGMDPRNTPPIAGSSKRMETFEPICRGIAAKLVRDLNARGEVEFIEHWMTVALGAGAGKWLRGRAGLRCRILSDGVLRRAA